AMDSIYFNGFSDTGTGLVLRIARRHNNIVEIWFLIDIPGIGSLQLAQHPDSMVCNNLNEGYNALGLEIKPVEAMKIWKITYNGLCRWKAYTAPFDFDTELHPMLLADSIARENWSREFFDKLKLTHQTHYEQWGQIEGKIYIEGHDEHYVMLRGLRDHTYGVRGWQYFHRYAVQMGYMEDGSTFHVGVVSFPDTTSYLGIGYIFKPNGCKILVSSIDMPIAELGEDGNPPRQYKLSFVAGGTVYYLRTEVYNSAVFYCGLEWDAVVHERMCHFTLNGVKGWGISEFQYRYRDGCPVTRPAPLPTDQKRQYDEDKLVLPLASLDCQNSHAVGGKGSQLAVLSQLQRITSNKFSVPNGICVTMTAFEKHIQEFDKLQKLLEEIENVSHGLKKGDLEVACQICSGQFEIVEMTDIAKKCIQDELSEIFGLELENKLFAVRSSAVGEDTSEMSAAGQMRTELGVQGISEIFKAVCKCWASQYSYHAVQYRRQHGQPVRSSMAVVIQEMVTAQSAGVLFSRHPITGHPGQMVINANYGLGESVVSGSIEPDTITLACKNGDRFDILSKEIGSKEEQMLIADKGGVSSSKVTTDDARQCCLSDATVLQLANTAKLIENCYGNPRDIEWAIKDNHVYVLQARPITTLDMESDEDIMTEFDTPLAMKDEWITNANIGEMMPGAITPLTISVFVRTIEYVMQRLQIKFGLIPNTWPVHKALAVRYAHAFINLHMLGNISTERVSMSNKEMGDLSIFGRVVHDLTPKMLEDYNGREPFWRRHWNSLKYILYNILNRNRLDCLQRMADTITFKYANDNSSSLDLYQEITDKLPDYMQAWDISVDNTAPSGIYSGVLTGILASSHTDWNHDHFSDMATLLSDCKDVASAEVPIAMEAVTKGIVDCDKSDEFMAMGTEEAIKWLKSSDSGLAGKQFRIFLKDHGHRCIREAEMRLPSWHMDASTVIPIIQTMLKHPHGSNRKETTIEDAIGKLKSPVSFIGKYFLRWILPRARKAVGWRESGKSLAVKVSDHVKGAYWKLAELLTREGRIPDKDLLFFFTHQEIGVLIKTRNPSLVAKAIRRRRVLPTLMDMEFPEISVGLPQPLKDEENVHLAHSVQMSGMPVCHGVVKGTARVITKLEDAKQIQSGEILIVPYTDVGWTPYFPLIDGLVTELGGLLSHGAVVAREYGLACVVNVKRATSVFKSGDYVLLNGVKGTIEKLEK
ncbi:rifampicin phosphotransferase-like, partial [Saccoglossus kowalevskii]